MAARSHRDDPHAPPHLRPVEDGDLDDLFAVYSNPEAMRYWSRLPHESRSDTAALIVGLRDGHAVTGAEFVIEHRASRRVIGKAGLWRIAEIGYILHPAHWRQGLMHEALTALLPFAFARHPGIDAITAETDPRNLASAGLLSGLGFYETHRAQHTLLVGDEWCDSSFWRLDRPPQG